MSSNNLEGIKNYCFIGYIGTKTFNVLVFDTVTSLKNGSCIINYTNIKLWWLVYTMCINKFQIKMHLSCLIGLLEIYLLWLKFRIFYLFVKCKLCSISNYLYNISTTTY